MQTEGQILDTLQTIATAQLIMAVATGIIALIAIGGALVALLELRSVRRLARDMIDTLESVKPRLVPLLDRAKHVTDEVSGMTGDARRRMDDILHTVEELRRSLEEAGEVARQRARRFDAVLEVAQTDTEDLLLDVAATAKGLQETARALREAPPPARSAEIRVQQAGTRKKFDSQETT